MPLTIKFVALTLTRTQEICDPVQNMLSDLIWALLILSSIGIIQVSINVQTIYRWLCGLMNTYITEFSTNIFHLSEKLSTDDVSILVWRNFSYGH